MSSQAPRARAPSRRSCEAVEIGEDAVFVVKHHSPLVAYSFWPIRGRRLRRGLGAGRAAPVLRGLRQPAPSCFALVAVRRASLGQGRQTAERLRELAADLRAGLHRPAGREIVEQRLKFSGVRSS